MAGSTKQTAETTKSSCCDDQENVIEMIESGSEDPHSVCTHHQGKSPAVETGLQGLKYKALCSCEDQQQYCGCRVTTVTVKNPGSGHETQGSVRLESWGKWKCYALSILVVGIGLWLILFFSLYFGI